MPPARIELGTRFEELAFENAICRQMLPLSAVRASGRASTTWSSERLTFDAATAWTIEQASEFMPSEPWPPILPTAATHGLTPGVRVDLLSDGSPSK